MKTITKRLDFMSAHRVTQHESKCRNLHGHHYFADIVVGAESLDDVGRVIDFGVVREVVGGWIDSALDHGTILNLKDVEAIALCRKNGWRLSVLEGEPTVENLAELLFERASLLLVDYGVKVVKVVVHETPTCSAEYP